LAGSVAFIDTTTLRTCPRGVAWIDKDNLNSGTLGFVDHKALELAEGPRMQTGPLLSLSPYPATNALQVFQGNTAPGAFSNGNYFFGNLVVNVGGEPALFEPALTQKAFGASGAFGLQVTTHSSVPYPSAVELSARIAFTITGLSDSDYTQINADKIRNFSNSRCRLVNRNKQEPFAVAIDEIGFTASAIEESPVTFATRERDSLPSAQGPDTYRLRSKIPGQDARIVGNRAVSTERASHFIVELISIGNFGYKSHHNLSGKRKFSADGAVTKPVNIELSESFGAPAKLTNAISRDVGAAKSFEQNSGLFGRGQQFNLGGKLHRLTRTTAIPLPAKAGSLLAAFL
jgi:hypothetical protein